MKTYTSVICVVLLLGVAATGYCQLNWMGVTNDATSARWAGMGGVGIAAATDAAAIDFNPASLPWMELATQSRHGRGAGDSLDWQAIVTWGSGAFNDLSLKLGAVGSDGRWGAGASYEHASSGWSEDIYSLGYGSRFSDQNLSWGISGNIYQYGGSSTYVNAGLLYAIPTRDTSPIKLGLLLTNLFQDDGDPMFFNLGVAIPLGEKVLLGIDAWDLTDEWDTFINAGVEYQVAPNWCLRAGKWGGDSDPKYTVGAGYAKDNFSVDVADAGFDDGAELLISAGWKL